jgi:hypothetical protein
VASQNASCAAPNALMSCST